MLRFLNFCICFAISTTATHAETIRCPDDWRELTLAHEGAAALREADPTADFEAVLASAEAKNISGPLSSRVARSLDASKKKAEASSSEAGATSPKVTTPTTCSYTVKSSDTLANIAAREFGNGNKWTDIRELNRDNLKNPNVLRVGQILKLPCDQNRNQKMPDPIWTAKRGSDFTQIVQKWAKKAGYRVVTKSNAVWKIDVDVRIQGNFERSLQELVKGMANGGRAPGIKIYPNKIIEIS